MEWLCGFLTGHELSETEWGYGGGNYVDRHCRWCDRHFQIPKREELIPEDLGDIIEDLNELGWDKDFIGR